MICMSEDNMRAVWWKNIPIGHAAHTCPKRPNLMLGGWARCTIWHTSEHNAFVAVQAQPHTKVLQYYRTQRCMGYRPRNFIAQEENNKTRTHEHGLDKRKKGLKGTNFGIQLRIQQEGRRDCIVWSCRLKEQKRGVFLDFSCKKKILLMLMKAANAVCSLTRWYFYRESF